jgi:Bax protein
MVMASLGGMVVALYGLAAGSVSFNPQIVTPRVVPVSANASPDVAVVGQGPAAALPRRDVRAILPVPEKPRPPVADKKAGGSERRAKASDGMSLAGLDIGRPPAPGYNLKQVRLGGGRVPHAYLSELPRGLPDLDSPQVRKTAFIKVMLPLILRANHDIAESRRRLRTVLARIDRGQPLSGRDETWLRALSETYRVALPDDLNDLKGAAAASLRRRVDIVPPSLAIAQAAEESGWGTSRFAQEGNAVYGQWTWSQGAGIVPRRRDAGKIHEVRKFSSLQQSVNGYMRNLNSHPAYTAFRARRGRLRAEGRPLTGADLVDTLQAYSERRAQYVETLRTIMRVNRLTELDAARLDSPRAAGSRL